MERSPRSKSSPENAIEEPDLQEVPPAPEGWLTNGRLISLLRVSKPTIEKIKNEYEKENPDAETVREYRVVVQHSNGARLTESKQHYSPELVAYIQKIIERENEERIQAPQGWVTNKRLALSLDLDEGKIKKIADGYREINQEWFKNYIVKGRQLAPHYSPELVQIIRNKLSGAESAPPGWMTNHALAAELGIVPGVIKRRSEAFRNEHPEYFKEYPARGGGVSEHYSPELVTEIKESLKNFLAPEGWGTASSVLRDLNNKGIKVSDHITIQRIADKYRSTNPEWFQETSHKLVNEYYAPALISIIETELKSRAPAAPIEWGTAKSLSRELGVMGVTISKLVEPFRAEHPEWFHLYRVRKAGLFTEHYSPELVESLKQVLLGRLESPAGWITNKELAEELSVSERPVQNRASRYKESHPEWFQQYKSKSGVMREFYSPELREKIKEEIEHTPAPDGWVSNTRLAENLSVGPTTVTKIADTYRGTHNDWFQLYKAENGSLIEHYSPELIGQIKAELEKYNEAPSEWVPFSTLAKELGTAQQTVERIGNTYRNDHPEWFQMYKAKNGRPVEHYSPELVSLVKDEVSKERLGKEMIGKSFEEQERLRLACSEFFEEAAQEKTMEAHEFKTLLQLFGSARLFDILYKYRPGFEGVPAEYVKGTLAKYLGDFLILRHSFRLNDLDLAYPHLSNRSLQDSLFEIIKEDCLSRHHAEKLKDPSLADESIIQTYLTEIREKAESLNSSEISAIADRVEAYYTSILHDFTKPSRIVESVKTGRPFPDLNQALNVKEIADKKKMLIGDEMGMGKSASAILSKEYLGSKLALAIVPSNVIGTWENYLSDKVADNGEQIGYFKPGEAPRVLVVEDLKTLSDADFTQLNYVLISQEKMNARYAEMLKKIGYDMLIVDEVHKFKNLEEGARSESMLELADQIDSDSEHLVLLSGTPIPNKIRDVAMILKLLYPDRFSKIEDAELVESVIRGDIVDIRNLLVPHMQMKTLRESIKMPELYEKTDISTLSLEEKDIYEILLEDDELTADQKIRAFRKFIMNPTSLEVTPNITGSKITDVGNKLREVFESKRKVVFFVNGYVEGMIRGKNTIIEQLGLPADVKVRIIEGTVDKEERERIQQEFKDSNEKILLAVSGQTADVGVDFSAAEYMEFYNDPWTLYDKKQQIARGYRPGLENDLTVGTSIVEGTIEEGIAEYIQLKYDAIQKVLKGVPITEIEKGILRSAEKQKTPDIEGSLEIAKDWLNSPQNRLHRFFGMTKEIGEKDFHKFLLEHGEEYAESYLDMGSLGFQANTARIVGTIINSIAKARKENPEKLRILDIASGPEMLKKHIPDSYKGSVFSMDINPRHFESEGEGRLVGSFARLPIAKDSMDYVNLSLALHYSRLTPRRDDYERLQVLTEMNRVLKPGGKAVISLLYSLSFKDEDQFKNLAKSLGFRTVEAYTGEITSGPYYRSNTIVLEKEAEIDAKFEDLVKTLPKEEVNSAKLSDTGITSLKNSRRCISKFKLNGVEVDVEFNNEDKKVLSEQTSILNEGEGLKEQYGGIKGIPSEEIVDRKFLKLFNGKTHRLLKKSEFLGTFVDVR